MADVLDKPPAVSRDSKGRFLKGTANPNPVGRPKQFKGLAAMIRAQTDDGAELVRFALGVFRNAENVYKHSEVWDAFIWLADRGFGKAVNTTIELNEKDAEGMPDLSNVPTEAILAMRDQVGAILSMAEAKKPDGM